MQTKQNFMEALSSLDIADLPDQSSLKSCIYVH